MVWTCLRVDVNSPARSMTVSLDGYAVMFTGADFDLINQNTGGGIGLMSWSDDLTYDNVRLSAVPLPGSIALLGPSLVALSAVVGRRRRS
ncbi:MAG: hypothetical protein HY900_05080 [Deltaproteobacteria bacterium]|nr:hypothetical protein [Deltaproteobacteria bacterium]